MRVSFILMTSLVFTFSKSVCGAKPAKNVTLIIGKKIFRNLESELNEEFGKYKKVLQDYYNRNSPSAYKVKLIEIISGYTDHDGPFGGIPVDEIYTRWAHTRCPKTDNRDADQCAIDQNVFKHWVCKHEIDKSNKNPLSVRSDCGWRVKLEHLQNHVIDHKISLTGSESGGESKAHIPVGSPSGQQQGQAVPNEPTSLGNAGGQAQQQSQVQQQGAWQRSDLGPDDGGKSTGSSSTVSTTHGIHRGENKNNDSQETRDFRD